MASNPVSRARQRASYRGRRLATITRRFVTGHRPGSPSAAQAQREAEEAIAGHLGGDAAIALGILLPLLIALDHSHVNAAAIAAILGVGAFAFTVGVLLRFHPGRVPLKGMDALVVIAGGLLILLSKYGPPARPALPGVYLMIGTIVFAVRGVRVSLAHYAVMGASYAGVLAVAPHPPGAPAQWVGLMGLVAVSGIFVRWLVGLGSRLAVAELEARSKAELSGAALAEQSLAKTTFISRMSHELRTPLNVVLGFSDLLAEQLAGPLNDRQAGYVGDISSASRHLVGLVDDVLDTSSVEAGVIELEAETTGLNELLESAIRLVQSHADAYGVQIFMPGENRLVEMDARKVRQVVVNLLNNATKFTAAGGTVAISTRHTTTGIRVIVRDEGTGISPEERHRIFETFATSNATAGSGLGLPLSRRIIEAHGGQLELVHSAIDVGSVFAFELPETLHPASDSVVALPDPAADDPAYVAFAHPDSAESRGLIVRVGTMFAFAAAVLEFAILAVAPLTTRQQVLILVVAVFNAATALGMRRLRLHAGPSVMHLWGLVGTCVISAGVYSSGSYIDLTQLVYGWVPMVGFALWTRRRATFQTAFVMVSYAVVVLGIQPFPHKLVLWLTVMTTICFNGAVVSFLTNRLRTLVKTEQTSRRAAQQVSAELAATSRHKSEFLANMSHELRTPLNAIVGFADLLHAEIGGPLNERQRAYVADIRNGARRLTSIINDVLDLAKLEAGRLRIDPQLLAVEPLLERAALAARQVAEGRVTITVRVEPGLDLITADSGRLEQVLSNLAVNGVKFTPVGGRVDLRARRSGGLVQIEVSDTGIGIQPEQQAQVFDPFHQGSRMLGDKLPEGTGLGLSLARSLIELHGGRIRLFSLPDRGSTFTVELPADTPSAAATTSNPLTSLGSASTSASTSASGSGSGAGGAELRSRA